MEPVSVMDFRPTIMLRCVSYLHARLAPLPASRHFLRPVRGLERIWLRRAVLSHEFSRPDDITVVIGVRNRSDYRLINSLRSIRAQEYPADCVRIIVVDYGSEPASARGTMTICEKYLADYIAVDHAPAWSRSRCLNIGIRLADSKFLMTSDVDVMFSPRYLGDAVHALTKSPLSVVCSPMLDLPEESAEIVERAADTGETLQFDSWRQLCRARFGWPFHPSIGVAYTRSYKLMCGYDEYYEVWGYEDEDLMRRFMYLGLKPTPLNSGSFYLHQWHPRFEGVPDEKRAAHFRRNRLRFEENHSILRNDRDWGIPRAWTASAP
jgi:predicted glycosyltransferase involved in capsule biosynthesis